MKKKKEKKRTDALEKSKPGTTKSWFQFNCACLKLFARLTKGSSRGILPFLA